jgi:hypothetical protein
MPLTQGEIICGVWCRKHTARVAAIPFTELTVSAVRGALYVRAVAGGLVTWPPDWGKVRVIPDKIASGEKFDAYTIGLARAMLKGAQ